jgi:hypothetical protein
MTHAFAFIGMISMVGFVAWAIIYGGKLLIELIILKEDVRDFLYTEKFQIKQRLDSIETELYGKKK